MIWVVIFVVSPCCGNNNRCDLGCSFRIRFFSCHLGDNFGSTTLRISPSSKVDAWEVSWSCKCWIDTAVYICRENIVLISINNLNYLFLHLDGCGLARLGIFSLFGKLVVHVAATLLSHTISSLLITHYFVKFERSDLVVYGNSLTAIFDYLIKELIILSIIRNEFRHASRFSHRCLHVENTLLIKGIVLHG